MRKYPWLATVLLFLVVVTFAEAAFVLLDTSGRSDALGECGVAGLGSSLKNPSNVLEGERFSLSFSHNELYNLDLPMEVIELKGAIKSIPLSVTINRLTDGEGPYKERVYTFTTGKKIRNLATGINLRRLILNAEADGEGWALDLGVIYNLKHNTKIGVAAQEVFSVVNYTTGRVEMPETCLDIGFAYTSGDLLYTAEMENFNRLKLGIEKSFGNDLMLRVGYTNQHLTAGLGLKKGKFTFDYAYVPHLLGNAHRLYVKLGL
jgi:hypothetical protein